MNCNRNQQMNMNSLVSSPKKVPKQYTLIVVKNEDRQQVLLGFKKRGFGVNKWNGFGGKVETGETVLNCAIRELKEECGLTAKKFIKHGVLWFENLAIDDTIDEVHLFSINEYDGAVIESEEMRPKWFNIDELPFEHMWPSNAHWLPLAINGKEFDAFFLYKNEDELINFEIREN